MKPSHPVPHRWGSSAWRAEAERWALNELADLGMRSAGPMSDLSIQAWSAVWRIPTSRGSVVLKQTTPGKAAEIAVYAFCAAVGPDYVDKPLSYDLGEARMLLADGGPTLHDTRQDTRDAVANAVIDYACFQQATSGHDARAKSTAIPAWNPADAAGEAEWQAQTLYSMPRTDLRHITRTSATHCSIGATPCGPPATYLTHPPSRDASTTAICGR